jgi:hypothetical protein
MSQHYWTLAQLDLVCGAVAAVVAVAVLVVVTVYWGTSLSPSWTVDMSHAAHVEL